MDVDERGHKDYKDSIDNDSTLPAAAAVELSPKKTSKNLPLNLNLMVMEEASSSSPSNTTLTSISSDVEQEVLEEEPRNIIYAMLSQLTRGMDLHKVSFPTFVLEPRSLLERITDFMAHPQFIIK